MNTPAQPNTVGETPCSADDLAQRWHLFRIDASDRDGVYVVFASAASASQEKARELAEAAVLDDLGTAETPATIDEVVFLGIADIDIYEKVGPI